MKTVAIQPDDYTHPSQPPLSDGSSPRWAKILEERGIRVRWVDVERADILDQLRGCDGLLWRWAHFGGMRRIASRILPVAERILGLTVYPDQETCWHYDDKIAQAYLFEALEIPSPRTFVWFSESRALEWLESCSLPLVMKLAGGAGSSNVRLVRTRSEARVLTRLSFRRGFRNLSEPDRSWVPGKLADLGRIMDHALHAANNRRCWEHGAYVLFQEFLDKNAFDTRAIVIGDRAFAFRRFNRANDFRASGSGHLDTNPDAIDHRFLELAFLTARRLRMSSCAIDGLYRHGQPVVGEVSYTYVSSSVHDCPGHWLRRGDAFVWKPGPLWPEEAQMEDFLRRLEARR